MVDCYEHQRLPLQVFHAVCEEEYNVTKQVTNPQHKCTAGVTVVGSLHVLERPVLKTLPRTQRTTKCVDFPENASKVMVKL